MQAKIYINQVQKVLLQTKDDRLPYQITENLVAIVILDILGRT